MAPYGSDEPLGCKHKQFNIQVKDAIANGTTVSEKVFIKAKSDLENLQKIDIASHNKNVEYILSVLKSDDMLYVSRVLKQSIWLVDDQYANIINPRYLNEDLFPFMKTKAAIKLLKHIRQHLKTEHRVEEFYKNETNPKTAAKWLSRCSVPIIIDNFSKHARHLSNLECKRIFSRSVAIFEAAVENEGCGVNMNAASFLLRNYTDKYLDVFENSEFGRISFGPTATDLLMKKASQRVINNFLKYVGHLHIPTFINNIKRDQIKGFVIQIANTIDQEDIKMYHRFVNFFRFDIIRQFVERMPKGEQFEFVKQIFLNRENILAIPDDTLERGTEMFAFKKLCLKITVPIYQWYIFAPFDTAFEVIKKLIHAETNYVDKYKMLEVLLKCAAKNTNDLLELLTYYSKTCMNDDKYKQRSFIVEMLEETEIYKTDEKTWNTVTEIINSMNDINEPTHREYNDIIILHNVVNDIKVPQETTKCFSFHTFRKFRKSLNLDSQRKLFEYLFNYLVKKRQDNYISTQEKFDTGINTVRNMLDLLLDWEKELADYPFVLNEIKELIRLKKDNGWKSDLSPLYNMKKSWKRLMFEESIVMYPSQKVCINALKHDPSLLARFESDVESISCNDEMSLKQFLRKIRIYWPDTLLNAWSKAYLHRLDKLGSLKASIRGICTLLSEELLLDMLKKFAPAEPKIDWNNTNELTLSLQRLFAKNMHIARPQPSADSILMFAKGDFLQYSLPSLLAIFYNMSRIESQEHIPKLLSARVSLQKHGLRFAFIKLKHAELKFHLTNAWQTTKNTSIRAVTFVLLFDLLCKEKDEDRAEELWQILEVFIDNLSFTEDKKIYEKLNKIESVPQSIKPRFLVKSYVFLKKILPHIKIDANVYEHSIQNLSHYTRNIMESMDPNFVENLITEYLDNSFYKTVSTNDAMLGVISSYLLCAKEEETQSKKYGNIFAPLISRVLIEWNEENKNFLRNNLQSLLTYLYNDLFEYVIQNKMITPTKIFKLIQKELNALPLPPNYLMIRMWQFVVKLTEIIENVEDRGDWGQVKPILVPEFGKFCMDVLREDVKVHFPCIYILFANVLRSITRHNLSEDLCQAIYEILLNDNDFIQAYLVVIQVLNEKGYYSYKSDECEEKEKELKKRIREHPSVEVRMHYYSKYHDDKEMLGI